MSVVWVRVRLQLDKGGNYADVDLGFKADNLLEGVVAADNFCLGYTLGRGFSAVMLESRTIAHSHDYRYVLPNDLDKLQLMLCNLGSSKHGS